MGYKYVTGVGGNSLTPSENLVFPNYRTEILDYIWNVKENKVDEYENRLNSVVKINWQILEGLGLQVRGSTDYTSTRTLSKSSSSVPLLYGYSGGYSAKSDIYGVYYGDALLTYKKQVTKDLNASAMVGYNARYENLLSNSASTNGGLIIENKFDLSATRDRVSGESRQTYFLTDAFLGTLNLDFKNYLYAEFTIRRDRTSTMHPSQNAFVYPSINAGFVLSDAFNLPALIDYAKIRASWGAVGNYPPMYLANIAYSLTYLGDLGSG